MTISDRKLLKKEIKQIKSVICAFKYKYFTALDQRDMTEDEIKKFDEFRNDTLFKLVDQWKKMELELMSKDGRLNRE